MIVNLFKSTRSEILINFPAKNLILAFYDSYLAIFEPKTIIIQNRKNRCGMWVVTASFFDIWFTRSIQFKPYLLTLSIWFLGTGLFFLWRWQYYGYLWPATVYAKTGDLPSQIIAGINYVNSFWQYGWLSVLALLVTIPFLIYFAWPRKETLCQVGILTAVLGGYLAFVVTSGGDWMPMFRFLAPILPILFLLLAVSLSVIWQSKKVVLQGGVTLLVGAVIFSLFQVSEAMRTHVNLVMQTSSGLSETGIWLKNNAKPDDKVALIDAGAIPYHSELESIDMIGLNDYHIATLPDPWFFKYDNDYILAQEPDYIQMHLTRSVDGKAYLPTDFFGTAQLFYLPEFHRWYEFDPQIPGTHVFKRLNSPKTTTQMDTLTAVSYDTLSNVLEAGPNELVEVTLQVTNEGTAVWAAAGGNGWGVVKLNFRLFPIGNHEQILQDQRVMLPRDLEPGETTTVTWQITAPDMPGTYEIEIDMLAETITWFSERGATKPIITLNVE